MTYITRRIALYYYPTLHSGFLGPFCNPRYVNHRVISRSR